MFAQDFRKLQEKFPYKSLIFVDEVGFKVSTRPSRGRSLRGESAYLTVAVVKTRNIAVFVAKNKYGMLFNKTMKGL